MYLVKCSCKYYLPKFSLSIAPDPIQCPDTHKIALEKGKCCCKEEIVFGYPSITTPCSECDDGDDGTADDKLNCFETFGQENCINHGEYSIRESIYLCIETKNK